MKTKSSLLSIIILFLVLGNTFAQKAKIKTSKAEVVTVISGIGEKEIYTESGVIPIAEIEKIIFEKFESQFESQYAKLSKFFPVEYGDGTNLGGVDGQVFSNPTQPLSPSSTIIYPEDYLIKASKSGLLSVGIFSATGIAIVATAGAFPVIVVVGGIMSLSFLVDGWAKLGKAGKMMKDERRKTKFPELSNQ
jgi:hypothetical protein